MVSSRLQRGGLATGSPGHRPRRRRHSTVQQLLHRLGGRKSSFREAPIFIYSPLVGLRPSRSGVSSTLQFPNRGSEISAPFAAGLVMLSCILSPACCPQSVTDPQSDRLRRPDCIRGGVDCSGSVCCRTCFKNIGPRSAARTSWIRNSCSFGE